MLQACILHACILHACILHACILHASILIRVEQLSICRYDKIPRECVYNMDEEAKDTTKARRKIVGGVELMKDFFRRVFEVPATIAAQLLSTCARDLLLTCGRDLLATCALDLLLTCARDLL